MSDDPINILVPMVPYPLAPSLLTQVRTAKAVKGRQPLVSAAFLANYVLGRGYPLVVAGAAGDIPTAKTFRYYVWPSDIHARRMWFVTLGGSNADYGDPGQPTTVAIRTPTGGGYAYVEGTADPLTRTFVLVDEVTPDDTPGEISIDIGSLAGMPPVRVYGISCYELPRTAFDASEGVGVDTNTLEAGAILYSGAAGSTKSYGALLDSMVKAHDHIWRRGAMFTWNNPDGVAITSTSYADLFPLKPALQTVKPGSSSLVRPAKVNILASVSGGTADVLCTMTNGDTCSFSVSSTTPVWHTPQDLDVYCDTPSYWPIDGGVDGRDEFRVQCRKNTSGTLTIYGVCVADPVR